MLPSTIVESIALKKTTSFEHVTTAMDGVIVHRPQPTLHPNRGISSINLTPCVSLVGLGTVQRYFWYRYRITTVLPGIDSEKIERCLVPVPSMSKHDWKCAKSATDSLALRETQQCRCQSHSCNSVWGYRC